MSDDRIEDLYHRSTRDLAERVAELEDLLRRVWNDFPSSPGLPCADEIQETLSKVFEENEYGEFKDA